MRRCWLCQKKKQTGNGSFFRVPKDVRSREKWSEICGIQFTPNASICVDHFPSSDIVILGRRPPTLLPCAMPIVHHQQNDVILCAEELATPTSHKSPPPFRKKPNDNSRVKEILVAPEDPDIILYENPQDVLRENLYNINNNLKHEPHHLQMSYSKAESRTISTQTNTRLCGTVQVSELANDYRFNCFYCSKTFPLKKWKIFENHLKKKHFDNEAFKLFEYISKDHDYTPINVPQTVSSKPDPTTQALHMETLFVDPNLILPYLVEPVELSYTDPLNSASNYNNKSEILNTFTKSEKCSIVKSTKNNLNIKNDPSISPLPQTSISEKIKSTKKRPPKRTSKKVMGTIRKSKQKVLSSGVLYLKNSIEQPTNKTALSRCLKRSNTIETIKPEEDKQNANESSQHNSTELTFEYTPRDIIDCLLDNMKNYPVLWEFDEQPFNDNYYEAIEKLCRTINTKWSLNIDSLEMCRSVCRVLSFYCSVYPCENIENINPFTHYFDKCATFLPPSVHDITYARCSHCFRCYKNNIELRIHLLQEQKNLKWPFKCVGCKECFKSNDEYELHKLLPHYEEVFRCKQCNKKFVRRNKYNKHVLNHQLRASDEPGQHVCNVCGKVFKIRSELRTHKVYHGERKHKCNLCPKKFATNTQLKFHVKTHTGQYDLVCEVCGMSFIRPNNLKRHMLKHTGEKITCNICNLKLSRSSLNRHLRLVHVAYEGTIETTFRAKCHRYKSLLQPKKRNTFTKKNSDDKNYHCKICNITFERYKFIVKHNKEFHSDGPKWSCKICTSVYKYKISLKRHYRTKHNLHIYQAFKLVEHNEDLDAVLEIKTEELDKLCETLGYSQNEPNIKKRPMEGAEIKLESSADEIFIEEERLHSDSIQDEIMKASDNLTTIPVEIDDDDDFFTNLLK